MTAVPASAEDQLQELTPLLIGVQANLGQDISLESLARQYGYSPFHFHRFFSKAVGETPKAYVDRLRLERAAYKLAITSESVLDIAIAVGFKNHETFTRAFKRAFACAPKDYRQACRAAQAERLDRNREFRGDQCFLSEVEFVTVPAMKFLAIRRHGAYSACPTPFQSDDCLWNELVEWAKHNKASYEHLALAISYDNPEVTPPELQRLDACIPVAGSATPSGRIRRLNFTGGEYAGIQHVGPYSTLLQGYRGVADGIRRSKRYVFDEGPPLQIYRQIHSGGDPSANLTEIYFPIRRDRAEESLGRRKNRQEAKRASG
jgi:AraC family transcriptional regulator